MTQIDHDVPNVVVVQYPFGGGHSRRFDPVLDDPFQLAIRVVLDIRTGKRRNGR